MPNQLVFTDKTIPFVYAVVCIMEIDEAKIDLAPERAAGDEVQRVYDRLGEAVEDIAAWLRTYGVNCESEAPRGGSVNTCPLAAKAGMGWQGNSSLLITQQYGLRFRIATIYVQEKYFEYTDSDAHRWIEEYCRNCERACSAGQYMKK